MPVFKPRFGSFGFDTDGMDRSVPPGEDFYKFANGGWDARTEIPADRGRYGMFTLLADEAAERVRDLVQAAASSPTVTGNEKKLGDFYASFMDEAAIEVKGLAPIQPELQRIAGIANKRELSSEIGRTLRTDVDPLNLGIVQTKPLFGLWISEDLSDPAGTRRTSSRREPGCRTATTSSLTDARFTEVRKSTRTTSLER